MKRRILLYASLAIFSLSSCSKNDPDTSVSSSQSVESAMTTGTWKVSNFTIHGQDHTASLNQFKWAFTTSGHVAASNDLLTENGEWSITTRNAMPSILFNMPSEHGIEGFQEISGGYWDVTTHGDNSIEMKRTIQDDPETDYLTIQRLN